MITQAVLPPSEALKGSSITADQSQRIEVVKDKSKDKGEKPSVEFEDVVKAKEVEAKAKGVATSQPSRKDNPPASKTKA
nr:hypothetical protein CFP56_00094 [Quercus suber]